MVALRHWVVVFALVWPLTVVAQPDGTSPVDPDSGAEASGPIGTDEMPGDPKTVTTKRVEAAPAAPAATARAGGYPTERILRPITLPEGLIELGVSFPIATEPFRFSAVVRGSYGITDEIEASLLYGAGTFIDSEFETGKAIAVDVRYSLVKGLAAQLYVPFYVDPFALGIGAGLPFRFAFFNRFAIEGGENLIELRLHRFRPSLEDASLNIALLALDELNETTPSGQLNLIGRFVYQLDAQGAVLLRFGNRFELGGDGPDDTAVLLDVGYLYALSQHVDFGARAGLGRLDDGFDSFEAEVFTALRL